MSEFEGWVQANMDVVLEEVCARMPKGGSHEVRKFVAAAAPRSAN